MSKALGAEWTTPGRRETPGSGLKKNNNKKKAIVTSSHFPFPPLEGDANIYTGG